MKYSELGKNGDCFFPPAFLISVDTTAKSADYSIMYHIHGAVESDSTLQNCQ